jgi:capsular polysaccharide biosynthesis protein
VTGAESDLQSTPADTQTNALTELLQTRSFDIAVGQATDLKSTFTLSSQTAQVLDDAYVGEISKNVQATSKGTNLYEITYTNKNPQVAAQVVKAVITQFQAQGQQFSVVEGERLLQADEAQVVKMQDAANLAAKNESTYLANHPGASTTSDPQAASLDGERQQALSTLQNMQTTIASLNQDIATQSAGNGVFFKILDAPLVPDSALSRSKNLITTGGIGSAVGLIVCILYIIIIVRRDRALYTVLDVEKATAFPILIQVPQLPKAARELVVSGATPS